MQLDGLLFDGNISETYVGIAWKVGLVFWFFGLALVVSLIYLRRSRFSPQVHLHDNALATLANLLVFSLMVIFQLAAEAVIIWWDRPLDNLQDMTAINLWPWIMGHLAVGLVWMVIALAIWGHKEIDTFIFQSAFPSAVLTVGMVFLGMLWWPGLFNYNLVTTAIMGAQFLAMGILSIPLGFLALFLIAQMFMWAFDL